jgi:hypothetical protein
MKLNPQTLYRIAEILQTLDGLAELTGYAAPEIAIQVKVDDGNDLALHVINQLETETVGRHYVVVDLEELEPLPERLLSPDGTLESFLESLRGLTGGEVKIVDLDDFVPDGPNDGAPLLDESALYGPESPEGDTEEAATDEPDDIGFIEPSNR